MSVDPGTAISPRLQVDYQTTIDNYKMLTGLRFKLFAFLPTFAGAAIVFMGSANFHDHTLATGLLGSFVTLGITIYDLRNSQFYEFATHRAKQLEKQIRFDL